MKGSRRLLGGLCALFLLVSLVPIVTQAAQSGFTKQAGHLNTAYIEWEPVAGATGYQVFIKKASAADSAYTRIDEQLVRQYPDHWRADALGLAAGEYVMKVLPVKDGTAMTSFVTDTLTVLNHERTGYAFYGGHVPGAYKMDGTLKDGAKVIYITSSDVKTLEGTISGLRNNKESDAPVDIRILGQITGVSNKLLKLQYNKAYVTIEGVGNDASAYGWGFELNSSKNVELANLGIMMVDSKEGDGVTVHTCTYTWVHNCDFFYNTSRNDDGEGDKEKGDGSLDTKLSQYITHSYNHFWDAGKCNLQGSSIYDTSDWLTYHHNWYDHSDSRHPRVRIAHVHVYNNYYDNNDGYGIGASEKSTIFADRNYFDNCQYPMLISQQGNDTGTFTGNTSEVAGREKLYEYGGMIKAYGNEIKGGTFKPYSKYPSSFDAYDVSNITDTVPSSVKSSWGGWGYDNFDTDTSKIYTYTADDASAVPAKVRAYAGRVEGGNLQYDMSTLKNANSKYPDTGLLTVLKAYTSSLVSVGDNGGATLADPNPSPDPSPTPTPPTPTPTPPTPTPTPPAPTPSGNTLGGTVYTLTGDEVFALMAAGQGPSSFKLGTGDYATSYVTSENTNHTAGTDGFFKLYYAANSRIDPVQKTFADDGYQANYRINFSNKAEVEKNAIQFTTDGPATVKVWWVGGGGASKPARSMTILDSSGQTYRTSESSNSTETPMFSTLELDKGGTWYLGGDVGKNFIYKVTVSVGGDSLGWSVEDDTLSITGDVGANQTVWAACWDQVEGFLSAVPLTGVDPTASLPEGWETVKLIWLDSHYAPKCPAGLHQK